MNQRTFSRLIDAENAPERLKGQTITAILNEKQLEFQVDTGDIVLTGQEEGYLKWFIGELIDEMKEQLKSQGIDAENLFGPSKYVVEK